MSIEQEIYITPITAIEKISKQQLTGILVYENGGKGQIHFNLGKITAIDDEERYEDFISFLYNCNKISFSDLKKHRPSQATSFESDKAILLSKMSIERPIITRGYSFYWQLMLMFMLKPENGQCLLLSEDVHIDNEIVTSVKIDSFINYFDTYSKLLIDEHSLSYFAGKIISPKTKTNEFFEKKTFIDNYIFDTKKDLPEFLSIVEKAHSLKTLTISTQKKPLSILLKLIFTVIFAIILFFFITD